MTCVREGRILYNKHIECSNPFSLSDERNLVRLEAIRGIALVSQKSKHDDDTKIYIESRCVYEKLAENVECTVCGTLTMNKVATSCHLLPACSNCCTFLAARRECPECNCWSPLSVIIAVWKSS